MLAIAARPRYTSSRGIPQLMGSRGTATSHVASRRRLALTFSKLGDAGKGMSAGPGEPGASRTSERLSSLQSLQQLREISEYSQICLRRAVRVEVHHLVAYTAHVVELLRKLFAVDRGWQSKPVPVVRLLEDPQVLPEREIMQRMDLPWDLAIPLCIELFA